MKIKKKELENIISEEYARFYQNPSVAHTNEIIKEINLKIDNLKGKIIDFVLKSRVLNEGKHKFYAQDLQNLYEAIENLDVVLKTYEADDAE